MRYEDKTLSADERADDLLQRMSLEEKLQQIMCCFAAGNNVVSVETLIPEPVGNVGVVLDADNAKQMKHYCEAIQQHIIKKSKWGIPALLHIEAISGGMFAGAATFPSAIGQAATWDPELVYQMANIIREQIAAAGLRHALSPVLDISRDPRWGRLGETYGEDPTVASAMGTAFILGMQGQEKDLRVAATGKHFVGHGAPEGGLNMAQEVLPERLLKEVHCKPFQAAISKANLLGVMNSYSMLNGEPIASSKYILTDLLRKEMKFNGAVVSDYIALDRLVDPFHTAEDFLDAGIQGLKAGMDVEYPEPHCYSRELESAVADGRLPVSYVDRAAYRVLKLKFEIGLFDQPFASAETFETAFSPEYWEKVSSQMAHETITLLKNENKTLPLSKNVKKIAVIGPHADSMMAFFGSFSYPASLDMNMTREEVEWTTYQELDSSVNHIEQRFPGDLRDCSPRIEKKIRTLYPDNMTIAQAIRAAVPEAMVVSSMGCNAVGNNLSNMEDALAAAAEADVVVLTLGGKCGWGVTSTAGEGVDSTDIGLPGLQETFARQVYALHKKTVVVHIDGRPLSSEYVASHFDAILEAWQLGQFGGTAIADVLFGDHNPGGHLTVTAARNAGQVPVYHSLPRGSGYIGAGHTGMIKNNNGYINDTALPLYCFGHGLSYTQFTYRNFHVKTDRIAPDEKIFCSVDIENTGDYDGDEVVQIYISDEVSSVVRPEIELVGFKRIHLEKGQTKSVSFTLSPSQLAFLDLSMQWKVEKGNYQLKVGSSCFDIRGNASFALTEDFFVDQAEREFYADASETVL